MAVLSDKGAVCSDPLCRQRDFLPFQCNNCDKVFCVEHYLPDCHSCPKKGICDRRVYVCPACLDVVRMVELETDEDAARRHRPQCKPELRAQREEQRKGRTCPVKGCKERLTAISSINCPHCHVDVCIKHRLKEDHNCDILKATRKESKRNYLLRQLSSNSTRGMKMRWHSGSSSSVLTKTVYVMLLRAGGQQKSPRIERRSTAASVRLYDPLLNSLLECQGGPDFNGSYNALKIKRLSAPLTTNTEYELAGLSPATIKPPAEQITQITTTKALTYCRTGWAPQRSYTLQEDEAGRAGNAPQRRLSRQAHGLPTQG